MSPHQTVERLCDLTVFMHSIDYHDDLGGHVQPLALDRRKDGYNSHKIGSPDGVFSPELSHWGARAIEREIGLTHFPGGRDLERLGLETTSAMENFEAAVAGDNRFYDKQGSQYVSFAMMFKEPHSERDAYPLCVLYTVHVPLTAPDAEQLILEVLRDPSIVIESFKRIYGEEGVGLERAREEIGILEPMTLREAKKYGIEGEFEEYMARIAEQKARAGNFDRSDGELRLDVERTERGLASLRKMASDAGLLELI